MLPKFLNVCAPRAPSYSEDKLKLKSYVENISKRLRDQFSRCEVKKSITSSYSFTGICALFSSLFYFRLED